MSPREGEGSSASGQSPEVLVGPAEGPGGTAREDSCDGVVLFGATGDLTAKKLFPDGAYAVLGQTWADIEAKVLALNLGTIDVVQGHKVWVDNPSLTCPDGIDVARVVREWQARRGQKPPLPPGIGDPDARFVPETGAWLQFGFKAFWEANGDALKWLGYPVENERGISGGLSIQPFERGVLLYDASQPEGWRVTALPLARYREFGLAA